LPIFKNKKRQKISISFGHIICPKCKVRTKLYKLKDGRRKCKKCGKKFVIKGKQKFKQKKLHTDVIVGFCLDFSALKTAKLFGYRYSNVLEIYYQLRKAIIVDSLGIEKLNGIVEADESYFGGTNKKRNKKYRKKYIGRGRGTDKTPVFGIRERGGNVFIDLLPSFSEKQIEGIIKKKVKDGSTVMTDEFTSYKGLIYKGYIHRFIEHGKEEYVNGIVHVNGMENFWSWAKEHMIKFHGVFEPNLIYYLKEIEWKFNNRIKSPEQKAIELSKLLTKKD